MLLFDKTQSITDLCVCSHRTNVIFDTHYFITSISAVRHDLIAIRRKKCLFAPPFKASLSVEAAVVMPILIFAMVSVMFFFRVLTIQWGLSVSEINATRILALTQNEDNSPMEVVAAIHGAIIKNDVSSNFILGHNVGIVLDSSKSNQRDIDITAKYFIKSPINYFGINGFPITQRIRIHKWIGYDPHEEINENSYVYIAQTGVAYHRDISCSYLSPSINAVSANDVGFARNKSSGKYYPCEKCGSVISSVYYIADYGTAFHSSIGCSSLSRSIRQVTEQEAINMGRHSCSKCG